MYVHASLPMHVPYTKVRAFVYTYTCAEMCFHRGSNCTAGAS